jgi:hypothetical protein
VSAPAPGTEILNLVHAGVLAAFFGLAARAFVLALTDPRSGPMVVGRVLAGTLFVALGSLYAVFTASMLAWDAPAIGAAILVGLVVLSGTALRHALGWTAKAPGAASVLTGLVLVLLLVLVAMLSLMRAGFLALTEDRPILLVDVTGETARQSVRWAAPGQPPREEPRVTHRVVFRQPDGAPVAEAWVYGDQVAVKGRVLRLSPWLNAVGVPNLFELTFAHNGYETADRHAAEPHMAVPLPPGGPLAVHPWWRPLQAWLLARWERRLAAESPWGVRSTTVESTYFPLADAAGAPVKRTFRLVLTPGGLSAG